MKIRKLICLILNTHKEDRRIMRILKNGDRMITFICERCGNKRVTFQSKDIKGD